MSKNERIEKLEKEVNDLYTLLCVAGILCVKSSGWSTVLGSNGHDLLVSSLNKTLECKADIGDLREVNETLNAILDFLNVDLKKKEFNTPFVLRVKEEGGK